MQFTKGYAYAPISHAHVPNTLNMKIQPNTKNMPAPLKNQFWKKRSKHGRDKIFSTPDNLWRAASEYFEATDKRVWSKKDWIGIKAIEVSRESVTPYTWSGFYLFLDITHETWRDYEKREDFIAITNRIRNIIYTQKFEGAAVGAFNANIIARDLALRDGTDVTTDGEKISSVQVTVIKSDTPLSTSEKEVKID